MLGKTLLNSKKCVKNNSFISWGGNVFSLKCEFTNSMVNFLKSKNKTVTASKNKGNVCVFTADTLHSVSPITEGTRKCAIFWFHKK